MAVTDLGFTSGVIANGSFTGSALGVLTDTLRLGSGGTGPAADVVWVFGSTAGMNANGQASVNQYAYAKRTVTATTADNLNLLSTPTLTDRFGNSFAITKLKYMFVAIDTPDGTLSVRVGPQAVSNAAQLDFGGIGSTAYSTVHTKRAWERPVTGWTITTGTADILGIYNPSATSMTYHILLMGT